MALFPIFWKKIEKNLEKNFQNFFFFTKICFSELEKAYVQLFVLKFFFVQELEDLKKQAKFLKIAKNLFLQIKTRKKIQNQKLYIYFFQLRKRNFSKKKIFFENFFPDFFQFFFQKMGKIKKMPSDIFNFHIFLSPHTHRYHLLWNFTRA